MLPTGPDDGQPAADLGDLRDREGDRHASVLQFFKCSIHISDLEAEVLVAGVAEAVDEGLPGGLVVLDWAARELKAKSRRRSRG